MSFKDYPNEWCTSKFKNIFYTNQRNGLTKPKRVRGKGIKMVNMGELFSYDWIYDDMDMELVPISEKEYNKYILEEGDLLFARQSLVASGAGKCSIIIKANEDLTFESHLIRVRLDHQKTIPLFYYYYFNSSIGHNSIYSIVEQVAAAGIRSSDLIELEVPIPPLEEQKAIAKILSSLDKKIEINNQMNKTLEEMAQSIYKSWFVDFEPFQDGNFVESEFGLIPEGWEVKEIKDISKIILGKTPSTRKKENYGTKYPFIKIPDMHEKMYVIETERMLSETGHKTQENKLIPPNSISVSCIGTVGLVTLNSKPSHTNQQINTIVCKDKLVEFSYFSMKNMKRKLIKISSGGTTIGNINKETFQKLKIIKPDDKILMSYHKIVKPIFTKIMKNLQQNQTLKQLRDTLLPKLMSGEIRVPIDK